MTQITLITGSTLGSAEYVAEHLSDKLLQAGYSTEVIHGAQLDQLPLQGYWLLITSTHGAGEVPENLQPLLAQLNDQRPALDQINYGAIGLGNKEYDQFCGAIKTVDHLLTQLSAKRIGSVLEIDVTEHQIPEDPAEIWLEEWITLINNS